MRVFLIFRRIFIRITAKNRVIAAVLVTAAAAAAIIFWQYILSPEPSDGRHIILRVENGMNPARIGRLCEKYGLVKSRELFLAAVTLTGRAKRLKAGTYRFTRRVTVFSLINDLSSGREFLRRVTIPEGFRSWQIASVFQRDLGIDSSSFMQVVNDKDLCDSLQIPNQSLEGYLFPDTYYFPENAGPETIVTAMYTRFTTVMRDSLAFNPDSSDFNLHQLVTLASIIEGEVMSDSERPTVSALYRNRLAVRMYLESCPTIQYIIPDGPRRLLDRDLDIESPYNTYRNFGLPPGPVSNPGMESLAAAMRPADTDVLFMVSNGDGTHTFSKNLNAHLRAKRRFDQIRRQTRWNN